MLQPFVNQPNLSLPYAARAAAEDALAPVEVLGTNHRFVADQALFVEGAEAHYCYKILSGAVRICQTMPDGRRQVTNFLLAGDLVGFDLEELHLFTVEAVVESVVRRYPKPSLDRLMNESPRAAQQVLSMAVRQLASAQKQMLVLGCKSATERLAGFLFDQAGGNSERRADARVTLLMNRADIADHLGLTVETVSRLFTKLRRDQIIELPTAQCVVILDWEALAELCESAA
jgi:CRP-like cAMP-binding protein